MNILKKYTILLVAAIFAINLNFVSAARAADSYKPSIKDVLIDEKSVSLENENKNVNDGEFTEPSGNHGLHVEELDEKIVIHWRGYKKDELLTAKIKSRGLTITEYHIFKSTSQRLNFVLTAKIAPNKNGIYRYEDFDLANSTTYYYKIMTLDSDGNLNEYIKQFSASARDINKPKKPKRPELISGDGFVKLTWSPYTGTDFEEYQILRSDGLATESEIIARIKQNGICQFVDSEIVNGKTYGYMLRVKDKGGNLSRESDEIVGKPRDQKAPNPPQNLKAVPQNNAVILKWQKCEEKDVEYYKIYKYQGELKPGSKFKPAATVKANDSFINSFEIKELKNGQVYYFSVSAVDFSGNESGQAFEVRVSPIDFAPPKVPSYIKVSPLNGALKIEWAQVPDLENDLHGYRIYRKSAAFPKFIAVADITKPKESNEQIFTAQKRQSEKNRSEHHDRAGAFYPIIYQYTDAGLYNGMTYTYYIVAFDKKGNESAPTEEADGRPKDSAAPEKVSGLKAVSKIQKIELKWTKNKKDRDLLGYYIYRKKENDEKYMQIAEIKNLTQNTYLDTDLAFGTKYFYRVSAFDESGNESIASNEVDGTAKFSNQISFSRAYIKNYPYTYCFSVNPNDLSVTYSKSQDNIGWSSWHEKIKLPSRPPNFGRMVQFSVQKWLKGLLVYCYNPETLDLYFINSPDEQSFGTWQLLFNRIELPPNFGKRCFLSFEKDEKAIYAFAYNPLTGSAYYSLSRDLEHFLRWTLCGLKVATPPIDNDFTKYSITSDDKGFYLFGFDLDSTQLMQSFCFDKKHWKAWYKFAKNIKKPINIEK